MPRVLFVSKPIAPPFHDGTKCLVRDVARELTRFDRTVLTTRRGRELLPPGVAGRVVYQESGRFSPAFTQNARAAISLGLGARADLWHFVFAPNARTGQAARLLKRWRRIPIVQTVASPPRVFGKLHELVFGDALVVQSRATAERLRFAAAAERFTLPPLYFVPPPVPPLAAPTPAERAAIRRELAVASDADLVVYPGDLETSSGAEATAALARPLLQRFPRAHVVFAYRNKTPGAEPVAERLRLRFRGLPVTVAGHVSSMHALLAEAAAVVFPVDDLWGKVDQPIVLLEALVLGGPVFVYDHGPLAEVRGSTKVGSLSPAAWLEALAPVLTSVEQRCALGAAGARESAHVYAAASVARAYEDVYFEVLERATRSPGTESA